MSVPEDTCELSEAERVILHRYLEARRYGLREADAWRYAASEIDAGELRRLRRAGCTPTQAARILL